MALRRSTWILATGVLVALGAIPAAAAPSSVDTEAAGILASATPGGPVTVVTTTETADGPRFTTTEVDSRAQALDVISDRLDESPGAAVDVAHPVSIAASGVTTASTKRSNDTLRPRQWALNRLGAEKVWRKSRGKGVVVAVVDTGVRASHPDLAGRVLKGWDFVDGDNAANDRNGHGTHVAGIVAATAGNHRGIAGLAPLSKVLPVRVLDARGEGTTVDVARGITYAARKGADVINLSLAGVDPDAQVEAAVRYAIKKGAVVVAAAGNQGCGAPTTYPAAYPGVVGVGAIDRYGRVAGYSNCGSYVDVVAPGSQIRSTTIVSPASNLPCPYGTGYCMLDGTSMASPHVAAAAAILIARTKSRLSPAKVGRIITGNATDIGPRGADRSSGHGSLDVRRMLSGR